MVPPKRKNDTPSTPERSPAGAIPEAHSTPTKRPRLIEQPLEFRRPEQRLTDIVHPISQYPLSWCRDTPVDTCLKAFAAIPYSPGTSMLAGLGPVESDQAKYGQGGSDPQVPDANSTESPRKKLVSTPLYRDQNLAANNIYLRHPCDAHIPQHIASIIRIVRQGRGSPDPSYQEIKQRRDLHDLKMGAVKADVEQYFRMHIFPSPDSAGTFRRSDRQPMHRTVIPHARHTRIRVEPPTPDILYGYRHHAFSKEQQAQLLTVNNHRANHQGLIYPFFFIVFKADGPSGARSLWTATNECLAGSAGCINMIECLNKEVSKRKGDRNGPHTESAAFSISMSGTEARLHVSWKQDKEYHMVDLDSYLLQKPRDYIEFGKCVRNIIDWGKGQRLDNIRAAIEALRSTS
ncbi:hypothetical protein GQX73_g2381 [Xylaria multiplex]|uniref:DUF7924 domain-containing protein n=1 Tax=Xylaria multiplex TaxID=323545 RepID=A0A7C8MYE0_9PEZI|nr:hypothetical protein GQX73_g2381 [Xylaria multiplex]